jgi:hypothetical protein
MRRATRHVLIAAGLAAAALAVADLAAAHETHADGSSTSQAAACKLATALARAGVVSGHATASHCECLENKEDRAAPWSCTAFVTYQ